MTGATEASSFGGPTFHDRCRRLEWFNVDVQISWQARYFGHCGGLISWQVQWTFGNVARFQKSESLERKLRFGILMLSLEVLLVESPWRDVNLDVQKSWQAEYLWTLKCRFVAGAAPCRP